MRLMASLLLVTMVAVAGCASNVAACKSYMQGFVDKRATWNARTSPPTEQMDSAVSKLARDFFRLEKVSVVWYENAAGQFGVCTIDECPRGFFVYAPDGLDKEPMETRASATCPGDF